MRIAIDIMSGDMGPLSNLEGAIQALRECPELQVCLCGDKALMESFLESHSEFLGRISLHHSPIGVHSDLKPSAILRSPQITSLHSAIDLLMNKAATALVSSANTGAYMALCLKLLRMKPNLKRPAIGKILPSLDAKSYTQNVLTLDLGANIECSTDMMLQFASMGIEYCQTHFHLRNPRVAVLNIGTESNKGTPVLQEVYSNLKERTDIDFIGFIEGDKLLQGVADLVVCDGFHGNIALKTLEGTIKAVYMALRNSIQTASIFERLIGLFLKRQIKKTLGMRFNPKRYNGALFMGLSNDFVVKSHGNADSISFFFSIKNTYDLLIKNDLQK
jgi:glycerol-3-phosphate acyltransferase PlsX